MSKVKFFEASTDADQSSAFRHSIDEEYSGKTAVGAYFPAVARRVFGDSRQSGVHTADTRNAGGQERFMLLLAYVDENAEVISMVKPLYAHELKPSWSRDSCGTHHVFEESFERGFVLQEGEWIVPSWRGWFCGTTYGEHFSEVREQLSSLLSNFVHGRSVLVPTELRDIADRIIDQKEASSDVDIAEWARRLASDIAQATD